MKFTVHQNVPTALPTTGEHGREWHVVYTRKTRADQPSELLWDGSYNYEGAAQMAAEHANQFSDVHAWVVHTPAEQRAAEPKGKVARKWKPFNYQQASAGEQMASGMDRFTDAMQAIHVDPVARLRADGAD